MSAPKSALKKALLSTFAWLFVLAVAIAPIIIAALSPLQAARDAVYIVGEMGGIACLALLFVQPLLAAGLLPGFAWQRERRWHRYVGGAIVFALGLHIGGLYLSSPDDMTDALLLVAPTPFSIYGVLGLWAMLLTAAVAFARSGLALRPRSWRVLHSALAVVVVVSSVVHALMIEGVMGGRSKWLLCVCALFATTAAIIYRLRLYKSPSSTTG